MVPGTIFLAAEVLPVVTALADLAAEASAEVAQEDRGN